MTVTKRPSLLMGLLIGLLTVPGMMALFFIGDRFAGLPFAPFDLFDFVSRTLPGPLITFGIDTMVSIIRGLGLGTDLDSAAKNAELLVALTMFFVLSVGVTVVFWFLMNRLMPKVRTLIPGVVFGLTYGLPLIVLGLSVNRSATAAPVLSVGWLLLVFVGWAVLINSLYDTLCVYETADDLKMKVEGLDRRQFLVRVGGASAVLTIGGVALANLIGTSTDRFTVASIDPEATLDPNATPLPNANDAVQAAPGTRAELTSVADHYRIDISARPPIVEEAGYTLKIHGAVENPVEWSLEDIYAMPAMNDYITMSCISNPLGGSLISTVKWTGVSFQHILDQVKPTADATALRIVGADDFDEFLALKTITDDERVMLAYWWNDEALPMQNGFPLRTHIPNRYGMKQPKWIIDIEVVTVQEDGYWVRRGWSPNAIVRATSVIDTVAVDSIYDQDGTKYVPVGGIAWAGARGISKVQVRVDGGEWTNAQLRSPLSERTWYIWRYDWAFSAGEHSFEVRCVELDGTPQIEQSEGVRPDGATGIDRVRETLPALT